MNARDRRRSRRVSLPWTVHAAVDLRYEVQVIDLSLAGAMIEHTERFAPGEARLLSLWVPGADLCLRAQLVWSQMNRMHRGADGKGELRFRSGVHFPNLSEADEGHLRQYLASLGAPEADPIQAADPPPRVSPSPSAASCDPRGPVERLQRFLFGRSR